MVVSDGASRGEVQVSHYLVATVLSNHHLLGIGNLLYVLE